MIFPVVDTINPISIVGKLTAFERVLLKKQLKLNKLNIFKAR
jgi:hypothetical protein